MSAEILFVLLAGGFFILIAVLSYASGQYGLNSIKSKTVGDGQHGTARFALPKEILQAYKHIPFRPGDWRLGKNLPTEQGIVLNTRQQGKRITALVDVDDVHCLMIGAAGVGKTAFFLYPNLEYACASGMSFIATDTKGDLFRNYGSVASEYYGYNISVIDLRNPTRSSGNNFLHLVNKYMDIWQADHSNITAKAKAEKYAKVIAKTIISSGGDSSSYGQNAFFYDSAEGLLTAVILLLAEFLPPQKIDGEVRERRHIVSVFKLIQDLLAPAEEQADRKSVV